MYAPVSNAMIWTPTGPRWSDYERIMAPAWWRRVGWAIGRVGIVVALGALIIKGAWCILEHGGAW